MKEYENLMKKIDIKEKEIEKISFQELQRLVNEFDKKHYCKRFNTDPFTVLGALFGAKYAEKEIIKNGLNKHY